MVKFSRASKCPYCGEMLGFGVTWQDEKGVWWHEKCAKNYLRKMKRASIKKQSIQKKSE